MYRLAALVVLGLLGSVRALAAQPVKIDELMPVPDVPSDLGGGDKGFEWIEVVNTGSAPIELGGWKVRKQASTVVSTAFTFPAGTSLAAGAHLLVADDATYVPGADLYVGDPGQRDTLALPQGTHGDGVWLEDGTGTRVDTVVYGADNDDGITDDSGSVATSLAPKPSPGIALARMPDGTDTDLCGDDFYATPDPTPGATNPDPPTCDAAAGVVINELLPDPDGSDPGFEYVELYNGAGRRVNLQGWTLQGGTSSFGTKAVLGDVALDTAGFLVIGENQVAARDVTASLGLGNASSNADAVRLVDCAGNPVDTVVYGDPNSDGWVDDSGSTATHLAPAPTGGEALARRLDGDDSDQSDEDFVSTATLTPGAPNPAPPVCDQSTGSVVINELMPNPAGADSGGEWVELYNAGSATVALDGWTLRTATSGDTFSIKATFPAGTTLAAGDHLLLGEHAVANTDLVATLSMGNGSGGDGVRLVDCAGNVVDTVVYGDGENTSGIPDDSGQVAVSLAPTPPDDGSLARKQDGVDTDRCGDDFSISSDPTPGAANPTLVCTPSSGQVKLNEILPDPAGTDSSEATEWVELYNTGDAPARLDGWQIVTASSGDDQAVDVQLPPQTSIDAAGFFVIGNDNVAEADYHATFAIGNGTGGDAVLLIDCEGTVVDAVAYGSGTNDDLVVAEHGNVADLAPKPGSDQSLARKEDGVDTDSTDDWFPDVSPTPGATNHQDAVTLPPEGAGCNHRNHAPDAGAPSGCGNAERTPGGCSTLPLPFGGWELLPLLIAVLRRRPVGDSTSRD